MSKVILFALIVCLSFALASCSQSSSHTRREKISDNMYNYGVAAVEIADDYLSDKISISDAFERIDTNHTLQKFLVDREEEEYNVTSLYDTPVSQDSKIWLKTSDLYLAMSNKERGTGIDDDIKEARDNLANELWK